MVVITILAILAALLLPALKNAKEMGKGIGCMNNLKQVGIIVQLYLNDNAGYYPSLRTWGGAGEKPPVALRLYLPLKKNTRNWVWVCPSDKSPDFDVTDFIYYSYGINGATNSADASTFALGYGVYNWAQVVGVGASRNVSDINHAATGVLASESTTSAFLTSYLSEIRGDHSGGANVLFCDGHVGWTGEREANPFVPKITLHKPIFRVVY